MRKQKVMAGKGNHLRMRGMPPPRINTVRNPISRHALTVDALVSGNMVCNVSEDRDQRTWIATGVRHRELPDGMGLAAQVAEGDGTPRQGSAFRAG
jgi:hypothetical protein